MGKAGRLLSIPLVVILVVNFGAVPALGRSAVVWAQDLQDVEPTPTVEATPAPVEPAQPAVEPTSSPNDQPAATAAPTEAPPITPSSAPSDQPAAAPTAADTATAAPAKVLPAAATESPTATSTASPTPDAAAQSYADQGLPTNQVIIKYKAGSNARAFPRRAQQMQRLSDSAGTALTYLREMSGDANVLSLPEWLPIQRVQAISRLLMALPDVEYAEPDQILLPVLTPNDPLYSQQWDFSGAWGINAPAAWDITTGSSSIVVADIDTGITDHVDLGGRTVPGYDFITSASTANDGNGRDSDPSDPGDWVTAGQCGAGSPAQSSSWHGTHTAGTIGAIGDNSIGVTGINWISKILPVRVLGRCGGTTSDIADGMRWSAGLSVSGVPANPNPARVMNLSLGGSGSCGSTFQNAINASTSAGAVVVVAAGNNNANASGFFPANCNGVITVAATDANGSRASYSNYGATVEISAPGNSVLSTINTGATVPVADTYAFYNGTSMATPHVTGVVSLMLSVTPSLTPAQVLTLIQSSAKAFPGGGTCNTSICGSGIVNAGAAVNAAAPHISGNVDVTIAGSLEGTYPLAPGQATLDSYPGVNAGPVLVEATDGKHIVASIRANWILNGQYRSYSEMMGMPAEQLSTEYWMPWYNFAVPSLLDEQLRIGNADTTATSAQVAIGTTLYGPYDLNPGQSMRLSYPGVNNGPIRVWSLDNKKITAAMRAVWLLNGNWTSYSELMGLPVEKLATEYWMPWYDFASPSSLDEQIRVGNADTTATSVQISIGSTVYGPYPFNPGQSTRLSFPGVSGGPVRIWSTDGKKITAAMREVWLSNGNWTSYSEMMGLPTAQLSTDYWMPWYSFANSSSLDEQLRFANVDTTATSVQVSIGGTVHGPYALNPGTSTLQSYLGVQNGPVRIWSVDGKKIVASMRAIWPNASQGTSYSEMMGLPAEQLSDSYWFPWYNFAVPTLLDEQLRFALP